MDCKDPRPLSLPPGEGDSAGEGGEMVPRFKGQKGPGFSGAFDSKKQKRGVRVVFLINLATTKQALQKNDSDPLFPPSRQSLFCMAYARVTLTPGKLLWGME